MALTAATNFGIGFLALFVLSGCTWAARGENGLSLYFEFSITPKPKFGQSWCEFGGKVNGGEKYLSYGCGSKKVELVGPLGMKLNDTESWERQIETVKDLLEELKKKLLDMKAEDFPHSDSVSLQGTMVCKCGDNGRTSGSWEFHTSEQISYFFNSTSGNWRVHPRGRQLRAAFDTDRDLTNCLMKISNGDCKKWLEQILVHWDEIPETSALPVMQQVPALSRATAFRPIIWILSMILSCIIIIGTGQSLEDKDDPSKGMVESAYKMALSDSCLLVYMVLSQQRAAQDTPPKWPGPGALPGHRQDCERQSRHPAPPRDALGAPPEKTTESENPRRSDFQKSFEAGVTTDDRKERGSRAALPRVVLSPGTEEAAWSGRGRTATDPSPGTAEPPPLQERSEKGGGSWAGRKTPGSFPGLRQKSSTLRLERGGRKGPQVDNQRPVGLDLAPLALGGVCSRQVNRS
ncbi:UL16-binding protein 1-like [Hyaena hyaena]|uniref:UL16-binding protein 1-like n=1 Tax=Hyaena hyaena TaxID=95912 RepID=UPI001921A6B1|nr:UL16-binding protein 1-like [Hyaena hyaena]